MKRFELCLNGINKGITYFWFICFKQMVCIILFLNPLKTLTLYLSNPLREGTFTIWFGKFRKKDIQIKNVE